MGVAIEIERILSMGKPKNFYNTNLKKLIVMIHTKTF